MVDPSVTPVVTVPVVSAWYSKINWTQVAQILVSVAAFGHYDIKDLVEAILAAAPAVFAVVTIFFRTFMTTSVTPSSVAK